MDKNGIFKLLTSLFDFYMKQKPNNSFDNSTSENVQSFNSFDDGINDKNNSQNNQTSSPLPLDSLFSFLKKDKGENHNNAPLVSDFSSSTTEPKKEQKLDSNKPLLPQKQPPIQSQMLHTLLSHDEFVKHVLEKNNSPLKKQ